MAEIEELTETERLASELLLAAVAFERFSVDMTARMMDRFDAMERELVEAIIDLDFMATRNDKVRRDRIAELMTVAEDIVAEAYEDIVEDTVDDLQTVAETAEGSAVNAFALVLGAAFVVRNLRTVPVERLDEIADNARFEGATVPEWLAVQQADMFFRFKRAVMQGEANDLTLSEIIDSIRGTEEAQYQDAALMPARRNAETLARTAVQTVSTAARLAFYEANGDGVLKAVGQISTLDSRTSAVCIAYSGARWRIPGYEPIGHALPFNGGTPRHWRCRSQIVPIINLKDEPLGQQASAVGPVPAHWTYEDWLRSRPETEQRDILGPTKFDLWKAGKISLADLVDQRGNPLSVAELLRRFSRRRPD